MADVLVEVLNGIKKKFKDMGDGTHAEVVAAEGGVGGGVAAYERQEDTPHTSGDTGVVMLAIRHDDDTPTANDGDYSILKLDEAGRLKVATQPGSYPATTGAITINGGTAVINTSRISNLTVTMVASTSPALAGHNATFEFSNNSTNGTDGNWYVAQAIRSNANTVETATGVLTATPAYGWELSVNGYKWFRVRATGHTAGTATYTLSPGSYATEPVPSTQLPSGTQSVSFGALPAGSNTIGTVRVAGQGAEDAAAAGDAVRVGGRVRTAAVTTFGATDSADHTMTTGAALVIKPFSVPEVDWQYAAAAGGITVATAVAVKAAVASLRNYVTAIDLYNASTTVTTDVTILDNTTVIWRTSLPPGARLDRAFPTPLRGSVNTAINVQCGTAGVVYANAQGFVAL